MDKKSGLTFGAAVEALKQGKRVTRAGWNGRGMYLWLMPATMVKAEWCREPGLKSLAEANGGEIEALGTIRMLMASQSDILAEDWQVIEEV